MPIGRCANAPRDLVLVEPVPVLVHRREQRLEAVLVVVRRDADVVDAGAGRERMLGRVDAPRVGAVPEHVDDLAVERHLRVEREVAEEERVVDLAVALLGDERHELRLDLVEDARDLGRLHLGLEVVEQDVVRLVAAARSIRRSGGAARRCARAPEEELEVGRRLRLHPDRRRLGGRARHLDAELGRHVHGLVVRAAGEAEQAGVVGVGVERVGRAARARRAAGRPRGRSSFSCASRCSSAR